MKRYSPTLEGFRAIFRLPSLGLAEIAWRWSFGLATVALLALSFREYLSTLPVTATEMLMLQTRQPSLVMQAIARILQGSGPRAVATLIVLALGLTLAWIVLSSLGRGATLKALFEGFREGNQPAPRSWRFASLMGLNFLRAGLLLATLTSVVGAILLAGAASQKTNPSPGIGLLIFLMLVTFIGLAWSTLNSFLSVAAIFAVGKQETALGALAATVDLFRSRPGSVAAVNIWFGIAHGIAFFIAVTAGAVPLGLGEVLPAGIVLGGVLLVILIYLAVADFLYVGWLAAYVFMTVVPESVQQQPVSIHPPAPASDDDILSDIPGLVPPPHPAG
jgi:hypothetical protein